MTYTREDTGAPTPPFSLLRSLPGSAMPFVLPAK